MSHAAGVYGQGLYALAKEEALEEAVLQELSVLNESFAQQPEFSSFGKIHLLPPAICGTDFGDNGSFPLHKLPQETFRNARRCEYFKYSICPLPESHPFTPGRTDYPEYTLCRHGLFPGKKFFRIECRFCS